MSKKMILEGDMIDLSGFIQNWKTPPKELGNLTDCIPSGGKVFVISST